MITSQQELVKKGRKVASKVRSVGIGHIGVIAFLAMLVVVAIFAPLIAPHSPILGNLSDKMLPPAWMEGGNSAYILGTDCQGRDILSRIIYGARVSLTVAGLVVSIAGSFGTAVGLISGYFRGHIDALLMRVSDITLSLPIVLVAIVLAAVLGASFFNIILVIVVLLWPNYARQVRGEALSIREQDFVALASVAGCSHTRIMRQHIFPNVVPSLLVLATFQIGFVIILAASLTFLGVGIPPPTPAWGLMVSEGRGHIDSAWWISVWPGLAIVVTVLSTNFLGDWIRDQLDPKLRQV